VRKYEELLVWWQDARDDLYAFALSYWKDIRQIWGEVSVKNFEGGNRKI